MIHLHFDPTGFEAAMKRTERHNKTQLLRWVAANNLQPHKFTIAIAVNACPVTVLQPHKK